MPKGFTLIATTIITAILLVLGIHFISLNTTDIRIARAYAATTRAYYLAEAGTSVFIRALQDTDELRTEFTNGTLTQENSTITRDDILEPNDSFSVYATSTSPGEATIFAQGNAPLGQETATRKTQTDVFRALGSALTDYVIFTGASSRDIDFEEIDVTINNGIVFSNDDVDVEDGAQVTVNNGHVWAHDNVRVQSGSTLTINNGTTQEGVPEFEMPAMDFESNQPTSWRNQADVVMQPHEFDDLDDGAVLNGIIFVIGSPSDLQKNLTIHGLLVISGNFELEEPGSLQIIADDGPSGLLVKNKLEIENDASIEGLVYGGSEVEIEYDNDDTEGTLDVHITGGIIGYEIDIERDKERDKEGPANITITHDSELISRILNMENNPELESPIIEVNHWEEEY